MNDPKSAYELAMERLRKKDAEAGVVEQKLTDAQKAAIAEARSIYEARVAELQILHREQAAHRRSTRRRSRRSSEEYRRDLDRFATDRDTKISSIRAGDERKVRRPHSARLAWPSCLRGARRLRDRRVGAGTTCSPRIRQEGLDRSHVQALFATLDRSVRSAADGHAGAQAVGGVGARSDA